MKPTISQRKKIADLGKEFKLDFIILYGSQAKNQAGLLSDLDLAVYRRGDINAGEFADIYQKLVEVFPGQEVDLKSLSRVNPLFRYYVARDGQLLYGETTAYNFYKAFAYRDFQEAKPLFALEELLVKKHQKELNRLFL